MKKWLEPINGYGDKYRILFKKGWKINMKWLKWFGIIKRRNKAELVIISRLQQMDLSDSDRDDIADAVKDELDKQFK